MCGASPACLSSSSSNLGVSAVFVQQLEPGLQAEYRAIKNRVRGQFHAENTGSSMPPLPPPVPPRQPQPQLPQPRTPAEPPHPPLLGLTAAQNDGLREALNRPLLSPAPPAEAVDTLKRFVASHRGPSPPTQNKAPPRSLSMCVRGSWRSNERWHGREHRRTPVHAGAACGADAAAGRAALRGLVD